MYKFRRVAKELGYNADENLDVFSCCVPSHFYLYLKDATTIKEAMGNIKRACALGGVSVQTTQAPAETKTTPAVPFMQLNERQDLKTVSFKDDIVKEVKDSIEMNDMKPILEQHNMQICQILKDIKPILEKLTKVMEKTQQVAEKQYRDKKEVEGEKEEIVETGDQDHMIDQVHMIGQRVEKDLIVETEIVEPEEETTTQERRGKIQALDIPQVYFVIIVK